MSGPVPCPDPECGGHLQAPFRIPHSNQVHPPYCQTCNTKWPEASDDFDGPLGGAADVQGRGSIGGRTMKPEESLRFKRNGFFRDVLGFAVYDLEQGHRPDGSRQTRGLPDTLLFGHGLEVWIEYKDEGRKQTPSQEEFQRHVERNGGLYELIFPDTPIKDVIERWESHPDWRNVP